MGISDNEFINELFWPLFSFFSQQFYLFNQPIHILVRRFQVYLVAFFLKLFLGQIQMFLSDSLKQSSQKVKNSLWHFPIVDLRMRNDAITSWI